MFLAQARTDTEEFAVDQLFAVRRADDPLFVTRNQFIIIIKKKKADVHSFLCVWDFWSALCS